MPSRRCTVCNVLFTFQSTGMSRCPRHRKTKARGYASPMWKKMDRINHRCGDTILPYLQFPMLGITPCGKRGTLDNPITVHHVVSKDAGGSDDPGNMMYLCKICNSKIGTTN